jgi:hypothetical protein
MLGSLRPLRHERRKICGGRGCRELEIGFDRSISILGLASFARFRAGVGRAAGGLGLFARSTHITTDN